MMHNTICSSLLKNFIPEGTQKREISEKSERERYRIMPVDEHDLSKSLPVT